MLPSLLLVLVIAGEPVASNAVSLPSNAEQTLRAQLHDMLELWLKGDDAGTLQRMYPRWVEKLGPENVRGWLKQFHATSLAKAHLKVLSTTTRSLRGCAEVHGQLQCVVEGERVMQSRTGRVSAETQTLAFPGDGGKTWSFVPIDFQDESETRVVRITLPELSLDLPLRAVRPWIVGPD